MSDFSDIARRIIGALDNNVVPTVKNNGQCVQEFQRQFQQGFETSGSATFVVSFIHHGSAYEGLAVDVNTDFDIPVLLNEPFDTANFTVCRDPSGYFTLEWKPNVQNKKFSDCDGYLDAASLRRGLFAVLRKYIDKVHIPDAEIICTEGKAALKIEINYNTGRKIDIDMAPLIVFRMWGQCPDLKPLGELPKVLRQHIDTLNKNKSPVMCFSLAVPGVDRYPNSDQLFNVSFSLLEKEFLSAHVDLRDMVRMVKLVAKLKDWKDKYRFQPYFAKRMAVKHCDELKGRSLWEGYKDILKYLSQEVGSGTIDGFFVSNQITCKWNPEKAREFQEAIAQASSMDLRQIQRSM